MNSKQVFLYKKSALLEIGDLDALRDAGFVPVAVDDFSDVKVIDPYTTDSRSAVWSAAVEAIAKANPSEGVKTMFGRLLAEKLADTSVVSDKP